MKARSIKVYVVTATSPKQGPERPRTELAKFFDRAPAEAFRRSLHRDWIDSRVETRDESPDAQHEAHRDLFK